MSRLQPRFKVGVWAVDPTTGSLSSPEFGARHLEPKVMDVLVCLAERAGGLVPHDDLIEVVWRSRSASNDSLIRAVGELRRALGDDRANPAYIETVPKRGYRLIADVEWLQESDGIPGPPGSAESMFTARQNAAASSPWTPSFVIAFIIVAALAAYAATMSLIDSGDTNNDSSVRSTIAVLPFRNQGPSAEDGWFVDGIHDDIVTQLASLAELDKVISTTSTERFRDSDLTIPEIARHLGADTILEGAVQRDGDNLRINVNLIDAESDQHIWAEIFNRQLSTQSIFEIQSEIATAVVAALQVSLSQNDVRQLASFPTQSLEAYDSYLIGKHGMSERTVPALNDARAKLERAISLDPQFAEAYVGLSEAISRLVLFGGLDEIAYSDAEAAARHAIVLDGALGEAYASLGFIQWRRYRVDRSDPFSASAEANFERAIQLAPNHVLSYQGYALLLLDMGRKTEAVAMIQKALALDPLNAMLHANQGDIYAQIGSNDAAYGSYQRALELDSELTTAMTSLGSFFLVHGDPKLAIDWYRRSFEVDQGNIRAVARMISAYLAIDSIPDAEYWLDRLNELPETFWQPIYTMIVESARGNDDAAYAAAAQRLEQASECFYCLEIMVYHLVRQERSPEALELVSLESPALLDTPESSINQRNLYVVTPVAMALIAADRFDDAERLLNAGINVASATPRLLVGERGTGIEDAKMYGLLGRPDRAIAALQDAIAEGWRVRHGRLDLFGLESVATDSEYEARYREILATAWPSDKRRAN